MTTIKHDTPRRKCKNLPKVGTRKLVAAFEPRSKRDVVGLKKLQKPSRKRSLTGDQLLKSLENVTGRSLNGWSILFDDCRFISTVYGLRVDAKQRALVLY